MSAASGDQSNNRLAEAEAVCNGVLWLADNIHNYGSDQWRVYFMACVRDARRVVGIEGDRG